MQLLDYIHQGTDVVQKITIIPRGSAAVFTNQTPEGIEKRIQSKEDVLSMIRMTLGCRAAEEIVFGKKKNIFIYYQWNVHLG
ncbi:MAG: hypothetical protein ACRC4L_03055 [Mycoplasma sp.]